MGSDDRTHCFFAATPYRAEQFVFVDEAAWNRNTSKDGKTGSEA
jgi:hypothetical protein